MVFQDVTIYILELLQIKNTGNTMAIPFLFAKFLRSKITSNCLQQDFLQFHV